MIFPNDKAVNISAKNPFIHYMLILLAGFLVAIPIVFAVKVNTGAASNVIVTASESSDSDYTFIIINDDEVPLAAAPSKEAGVPVVATVMVLICCSGALGYVYWYISLRRSIAELTTALTTKERKELMANIRFARPSRLIEAEKEAEAYIANKYFDSLK